TTCVPFAPTVHTRTAVVYLPVLFIPRQPPGSPLFPYTTLFRSLDALCAPLVERHGDAARVRVEAVLEQLLEHRRGPLDHLAGGDLADQEIGQDANRWHAKSI